MQSARAILYTKYLTVGSLTVKADSHEKNTVLVDTYKHIFAVPVFTLLIFVTTHSQRFHGNHCYSRLFFVFAKPFDASNKYNSANCPQCYSNPQ